MSQRIDDYNSLQKQKRVNFSKLSQGATTEQIKEIYKNLQRERSSRVANPYQGKMFVNELWSDNYYSLVMEKSELTKNGRILSKQSKILQSRETLSKNLSDKIRALVGKLESQEERDLIKQTYEKR